MHTPRTESHGNDLLITGGTGFLGKAVLARLVDANAYERIFLLVRGKGADTAESRVAKVLAGMFPQARLATLAGRIVAVAGDLEAPMLGLSEETLTLLQRSVGQILHVGASTDFGAPLAESRRTNVEGTRAALEVAMRLRERGRLHRFDYVSTAYVAGKKAGVVTENDLVRGQRFSNNYEQSKYEAELLVRSYQERLPTAIYRPSIVVGDSTHGYTPHFKVLYWPLMLLGRDFVPFFAANKRSTLDVVPSDYVADGLVALMRRPASLGNTYHLTAGHGREVTLGRLLEDAYAILGGKRKPVIPYWIFRIVRKTPLSRLVTSHFWDATKAAEPYYSYLLGTGVRFSSAATDATLRPLGITPPKWDEMKRPVLGYCLASRWGRRLPLPEYAYYLQASERRGQIAAPATTPEALPMRGTLEPALA